MSGSASPLFPQDYHVHTHFSVDSQVSMAQMCHAALELGIGEIAFADHFDNHPGDYGRGFYDPQAYFAALEQARREFEPRGLTIRAAVELGEVHRFEEEWQPVIRRWPYDVVLGSLHWVGDQSVFDQEFLASRPPEETIGAYFDELAAMARHGGFDILAHPDIIKRAGYVVYGRFEIAEWEERVRAVWQGCIDNGIAVEINTSGLRQPVAQTFPTLEALRWYREMGGERLTIGTDSHRVETAGFGLAQALEIAREAGFRRLCVFERRNVTRWIEI